MTSNFQLPDSAQDEKSFLLIAPGSHIDCFAPRPGAKAIPSMAFVRPVFL
jgi:hypothetical protein